MPDNLLDYITFGMGNARSKPKDHFGRKKDPAAHSAGGRDAKRSADLPRGRDFSAEINERFAEDEELQILRHTINHHPELFILNNLMMSVQFFENFDEEIAKIRNTSVTPREAELNSRLPLQKATLIPDVLQEHVAKRVDFTYFDPTFKLTIELLHPIRIYMPFDNIEVTEQNYPSPYSSVNGTVTYSVQLKPSPSHKGYVLLRRLDEGTSKTTSSTDDLRRSSLTSSARDEIYSDGDSLYDANASGAGGVNSDESVYSDGRCGSRENLFDYPSTSKAAAASRTATKNPSHPSRTRLLRSETGSPAGSTSSGYRSGNCLDSDSDGYPRTTYNTPKTSKSSLDSGSLLSGAELPRQCFRKIEYTKDHKIYDPRREKRHKTNSLEQMYHNAYKRQNYTLWYLNSSRFMRHFCHLFADQLAGPMNFDPDIRNSVQGGVICRTRLEIQKDTTTTKEQFEIVPCVKSQWPECASEWLDRPRATWPSYSAIARIQESGCHLMPEVRAREKPDPYGNLEWQLVFPEAERYLETCLTYPQVRVYLIALMLQKTFIRPVDSIFGLTVSHIKHRLFWLVEEDDRPAMWKENRTGESLMKLLSSLYRSISQDAPNLPDYFVRDKNLLQDRSVLLRTQKQIKRIMENPVMYVFHAMENIRHSSRFFPRLNFEELFRILTAPTLVLVNPALAPQVQRPIARPGAENDYDRVGFWAESNQLNNDKQKIYARKPVTKRSLINTLQASDQVVQIQVQCEHLEPRRLSSLLDFFIRHFIKMAESCHNYRALPQKVAYVDHAERLAVLLAEHASHKDVAKMYLEKLYALKRRVLPSRSQSNGGAVAASAPPPDLPPTPPETPRRNADKAIFTRPLTHRYESPEDLVQNAKPTEIKEGQSESGKSGVYNLQAPPPPRANRPIVSVPIREEDAESLELRSSTPTKDEAKSSNRRTRGVSIAEDDLVESTDI